MQGFQLELLGGLGAPVILALLLVSILATTVSIFKAFQFTRLGVGRYRAAQRAMDLWAAGDWMGAIQVARADRSQLCAVMAAAMEVLANNPAATAMARQHATLAALAALTRSGRHLRLLETIVQAAPMLGLLGTVVGMIEAFQQISTTGGSTDPAVLAGGIWVALLTTAMGLTIAIPFYFVSVWLDSRLEEERVNFESAIATLTAGG